MACRMGLECRIILHAEAFLPSNVGRMTETVLHNNGQNDIRQFVKTFRAPGLRIVTFCFVNLRNLNKINLMSAISCKQNYKINL